MRQLVDGHGQLVDAPEQVLVQILHLVVRARHRGSLALVAVEKAQQHRALEARVADAVHAHAVAVLARAVDALQEERAHAERLHVLGHRRARRGLDAPLRQAHAMLARPHGSRGILAARQLHARQRLRTVHQVVARARLGDTPRLHHGDTIAESQRLVDVVADIQHRAVERVEQADEVLLQHALQVRVESRERLVQHEDARTHRQHAGQRHALLLAARQLSRIAPVEPFQPETLELCGHQRVAVGLRRLAPDARGHVLGHRQIREQHVALEQQRRLALLRREVDLPLGIEEHPIVHHDASLVRRLDAGDASHGKALPASRCAQKPQRLVPCLERHVQRERRERLAYVDFETHFGNSFPKTLGLRRAGSLDSALRAALRMTGPITLPSPCDSSWCACSTG